jgi:transaldolase
MTTLSVDTGDLDTVKRMIETGHVMDATTNPLFVSQAGKNGNPVYQAMVDEAVRYAVEEVWDPDDPHGGRLGLAVDRLAVNLGAAIAKLVPGYVSTEVNICHSFDTAAMHVQACRILSMYRDKNIDTSRVLIKLPGTWEGIQTARKLEASGFKTNITLVFGLVQAIAAAQAGAHLISPFPGRVLEWHKANNGYPDSMPVEEDPGVIACRDIHSYYKKYGYETICMPASWRSPTGADNLDEVLALAGVDRMTIPPALLDDLAQRQLEENLPRNLSPEQGKADCKIDKWQELDSKTFHWLLSMDGAANDKLAAGIRAFASDTDQLVEILRKHPDMDLVNF